jgi:hypothetical protein
MSNYISKNLIIELNFKRELIERKKRKKKCSIK